MYHVRPGTCAHNTMQHAFTIYNCFYLCYCYLVFPWQLQMKSKIVVRKWIFVRCSVLGLLWSMLNDASLDWVRFLWILLKIHKKYEPAGNCSRTASFGAFNFIQFDVEIFYCFRFSICRSVVSAFNIQGSIMQPTNCCIALILLFKNPTTDKRKIS